MGIGVLFGLTDCRYDFTGLLMHAEHFEAVYGVGPHTISVPRICPADDIDTAAFPNAVSGRAVPPHRGRTAHRRALHRHDIVSTRESQPSREQVLELGISQISGGSRTGVGGYAAGEEEASHARRSST